MLIDKLMKKQLPEIPGDILSSIKASRITPTAYENKNEILQDESLQQEAGFIKMPDGTFLVSMICPMPDVTAEMIKWWFWWHPSADERYKVWFPGEHFGISYPRKQKDYFNKKNCPDFCSNTHYPVEKIGKAVLPLSIDFVAPEEFGFSEEIMKNNNIETIVCGHVGAFRGLIKHTEMAHIFRKTDDGLFLISRFWLGETMKNPLLRKIIINERMAKDMAMHCCVEYRNLCEILPQLYNEYK